MNEHWSTKDLKYDLGMRLLLVWEQDCYWFGNEAIAGLGTDCCWFGNESVAGLKISLCRTY